MTDDPRSKQHEYDGTDAPKPKTTKNQTKPVKKKKKKRTMGSYLINKKNVTNRLDEAGDY